MPIRDSRLELGFLVRPAEASRVRELKPNRQVIGRAVALGVRCDQHLTQPGDAGLIFLVEDKLVRVGPAVGAHRHRLTAEDQLGPTLAEALPAACHFVRHAATRRAVPAFHRVNGDAVAGRLAGERDAIERLGQGRLGGWLNVIVARQIEAKRRDVFAEGFRGFQRRNALEFERLSHDESVVEKGQVTLAASLAKEH